MVKTLYIIGILLLTLHLGLSQTRLEELNHIASPKRTEILISLSEAQDVPIRIRISHRNILSLISFDTTIASGSKECLFYLDLEAPLLIPIEIDTLMDHIFLIPGIRSEIHYNDLQTPKHQNSSSEFELIEGYYQQKYDLLGVKSNVQEAFQFTRDYPSLKRAIEIIDSMDLVQNDLLEVCNDKLPEWFIDYEQKNIKYTSLTYKLHVASNLIRKNNIARGNRQVHSMAHSAVLANAEDVVVPFYLGTIPSTAHLKFCDSTCATGISTDGAVCYYSATMKFIESINDADIRGLVSCRILTEIYGSSRHIPDSLVTKFESFAIESKYKQRLTRIQNPILNNKKAPNFYLKDTSGKFRSLEEFKGSITLLNFWFVGCRPCQQEIPFEQKLVKELEGTRFQLVNICVKSSEAAWENMVEREGLLGKNLFANENWAKKLIKAYGISGYPRYVLLDENGIIIEEKCSRPSNPKLYAFIQEYLEK